MTVNMGHARPAHPAPDTVASREPSERARRSRAASRHRVISLVKLAVVARLSRDHRLHEGVVVLVVALAAVAALAKENQAKSLERLMAWDQKRLEGRLRAAKARQA
jgi:hypothetical protein